MRTGIFISAILHIGAIAAVVIGVPVLKRDLEPSPEIIPVEIVSIAETPVARTEEPEPEAEEPEEKKPEPPEQPPEEERKRRVAPPAQSPEDVPVPDPAAQPLEETPEPRQKPASKLASVTPRSKPRAPSRFDAGQIAALLDKKKAEDQPVRTDDKQDTAQTVSKLEKAQIQASLQQAVLEQVAPCWIVPAGAPDAENLIVEIRIWLAPDGSLLRRPEILDRQRMTRPGQEYFRVAAESAWRAVQKCAPYELPARYYDEWQNIKLNFDPREMLQG